MSESFWISKLLMGFASLAMVWWIVSFVQSIWRWNTSVCQVCNRFNRTVMISFASWNVFNASNYPRNAAKSLDFSFCLSRDEILLNRLKMTASLVHLSKSNHTKKKHFNAERRESSRLKFSAAVLFLGEYKFGRRSRYYTSRIIIEEAYSNWKTQLSNEVLCHRVVFFAFTSCHT